MDFIKTVINGVVSIIFIAFLIVFFVLTSAFTLLVVFPFIFIAHILAIISIQLKGDE